MIDLGLTPEQEAHAKELHDGLIVIDVMGIDGVGNGSDFIAGASLEQIATAPDWKGKQVPTSVEVWPVCEGHEGFEKHAKFGNITRAMVARGFSDDDIRKLMGGNWLRLLSDTIG